MVSNHRAAGTAWDNFSYSDQVAQLIPGSQGESTARGVVILVQGPAQHLFIEALEERVAGIDDIPEGLLEGDDHALGPLSGGAGAARVITDRALDLHTSREQRGVTSRKRHGCLVRCTAVPGVAPATAGA